MNKFVLIDEYGYKKHRFLKKVIKRTLKMEKVDNAFLSIVLINDKKMQELNKEYRSLDKTTDVLSFAFEDTGKIGYNIRQLGEIYISIPKMKAQALEYGHSEARELAFLTVHGLLHLLGYDHTLGEKEEREMFAKQEAVLNGFRKTQRK